MKKQTKILLSLGAFLTAFALTACDVAFDGPQYHFKLVNRTRGTIQNVTIGAWPCGEMVPGRSCTAPYMTAPGSITVSYQSASVHGAQDVLSETFTPDASEAFDEQNLYLDNGYFAVEIENHTTDNESESIDYLITGFAVSPDGSDFTEEYTLAASIDNDGEAYFLGFYDRYDPAPGDDTGIIQFRALVENDSVAEDLADWTASDLYVDEDTNNIEYLENSDGGGYYSKIIFYAPDNWGYGEFAAE